MLKDTLKEQQQNPPKLHFMRQAVNLEKLITMYETGEISLGDEVFLMNGRVVKKEDRFQRAEGPRWHEV
jgi:hypothetical protein